MKMMHTLKAHWWLTLLGGALVIVLGCYMLFGTASFMKLAVIIMGILAIVSGVVTLVGLNSYSFESRSKRVTIFKGVLGIAIGLVALFLSAKETWWSILLYIIGIQLVISAVIAFWDAFVLRKSGMALSSLVLEGVVSLVLALLMFLFPQSIGKVLVKIVGAVIALGGIGTVLWAFRLRNATKQFAGTAESTYVEGDAEVIDDDQDSK